VINNKKIVAAIDQIIVGFEALKVALTDSDMEPKQPNRMCRFCGGRFYGRNQTLCSDKCAEDEKKSKWEERPCIDCKRPFKPTMTSRQQICDSCREIRTTNKTPVKQRAIIDYSPAAQVKRSESQQFRRAAEKQIKEPEFVVAPVIEFTEKPTDTKIPRDRHSCIWCGRKTSRNTYCSEKCRKAKEHLINIRLKEEDKSKATTDLGVEKIKTNIRVPATIPILPPTPPIPMVKPKINPAESAVKPDATKEVLPDKHTEEAKPAKSHTTWAQMAAESHRRLLARSIKPPPRDSYVDVAAVIGKIREENRGDGTTSYNGR
jgi:predicted nucleic acid-binding Zn ribbon protein